jgi:hypothetical protein
LHYLMNKGKGKKEEGREGGVKVCCWRLPFEWGGGGESGMYVFWHYLRLSIWRGCSCCMITLDTDWITSGPATVITSACSLPPLGLPAYDSAHGSLHTSGVRSVPSQKTCQTVHQPRIY